MPADVKVYVVGTVALQPEAEAEGVALVSVSRYPVTATLSVAVKVVMLTESDVAVEGILKLVIVGAVVSPARVIVTVLFRLVDTLPAASFAQA